jgi:hypothetical protein
MSKCTSCNVGEFMAERLDAFNAANCALRDAKLPNKPDGEAPYDVNDVMTLACFILGMGDE